MFSAVEILTLGRGTIGALPRLARQEVVRPGRTEGYRDMAGSNRSQDILPHTACGSPAAGGARSRAAERASACPQRSGDTVAPKPKFPAIMDSCLRVRSIQ